MATHYYTRNMIAKVKVKQLKEKLNETLIKKTGKETLYLLADASLIAYHTTWWPHITILKSFGENLVIWEFLHILA